jgi:molecular chaperone GrpE (heat shock protein)
MLSAKVKEELLEAQSHLRNALKNSAVNEKTFVSKSIADILHTLDNLERTEDLLEKLDSRKFGDTGTFGQFFTDM